MCANNYSFIDLPSYETKFLLYFQMVDAPECL